MSSYPTWSGRSVLKRERKFVFKDCAATTSVKRRRAERSDNTNERAVKVPIYGSGEIDLDDITFIHENDKNAAEEPDGNLVEYISTLSSSDKMTWEFVVADEAHNAKKPNSMYNHVLRLLKWEKILWVTGTPILTSLKDLVSPLSLMWRAYGFEPVDTKTMG